MINQVRLHVQAVLRFVAVAMPLSLAQQPGQPGPSLRVYLFDRGIIHGETAFDCCREHDCRPKKLANWAKGDGREPHNKTYSGLRDGAEQLPMQS